MATATATTTMRAMAAPLLILMMLLFAGSGSASSAAAANSSSLAPISTGTPDGSEKWGYVIPRPGVHMFWLWYKSPRRVSTPAKPWPTVLWLQGGPLLLWEGEITCEKKGRGHYFWSHEAKGGSSVGRGNFLEIGPRFITMKPRPCTWLHVADLIFVDAPVGVGFSYADHPSALVKTDKQAVSDLLGVVEQLIRELPSLENSPVYLVGESYGGKYAALLGVVLQKAIPDGSIKLMLGGVVIGDGWISPADYAHSYGNLLHSVSRLNDNAVSRVNRMGLMVKRQMAAGQFAIAQKTWTDQLDVIDSQSDSVNMFNFLLDTGMNPVLSSSLLMHLNNNQQAAQSALSNNTDDLINRNFKPFLRIIPKKVIWEEATLEVYEALKDVFMKPAVREVDELLALGVSVTVYNGQYDVIVPVIASEAWVRKLKWDGLDHFLSMPRTPLHFCDSTPEHCSQQIRAYVRAYKNLAFYWILGAGHMVPVDQPYPALRMIANITQSPGNIDDVTCN